MASVALSAIRIKMGFSPPGLDCSAKLSPETCRIVYFEFFSCLYHEPYAVTHLRIFSVSLCPEIRRYQIAESSKIALAEHSNAEYVAEHSLALSYRHIQRLRPQSSQKHIRLKEQNVLRRDRLYCRYFRPIVLIYRANPAAELGHQLTRHALPAPHGVPKFMPRQRDYQCIRAFCRWQTKKNKVR